MSLVTGQSPPSLFSRTGFHPKGLDLFFPFIKSALKNACTNVYSSFVHNCSKLEVTFRDIWINKLWYNQTMDCYSVLKRNGLLSHEKPRRSLKSVSLSERSQSEKATHCMLPTTWCSGEHKTPGKEVRGCQGLGVGEGRTGRVNRGFLGQRKYSE